jgi:hypothetical protein
MTTPKLDPLFIIFEQHLYNFQEKHEGQMNEAAHREKLVSAVVDPLLE